MFIAINRLRVRPGCETELERRFRESRGLDATPGFLHFQLLKRVWSPHTSGESAGNEEISEATSGEISGGASGATSGGGGGETRARPSAEPGLAGLEDTSSGGGGDAIEYLAMSQWTSKQAFLDWTRSDAFKAAHAPRKDVPRIDLFTAPVEPAGYTIAVEREA